MNRYVFFSFLLLSVLAGCNNSNQFTKHASGLEFRFIESNTEGKSPLSGDIVVLDLKYFTTDGVLLDESDFYRMQVGTPAYKGDLHTGLQLIQVGDSVCFKLDAVDFYEKTRKTTLPMELQQGDEVMIYLRLKNIIDAKTLESERRSLYHADEKQELSMLADYLERTGVEEDPLESGLYVIHQQPGKGPVAEPGKTLVVHYTGKTIDGKIFDTSWNKATPLSFVLGKGEVIQGWEEGFSHLQKGGKARLIIPSKLAYGSKGFRDVILPYSTLIFDVELIDIQ